MVTGCFRSRPPCRLFDRPDFNAHIVCLCIQQFLEYQLASVAKVETFLVPFLVVAINSIFSHFGLSAVLIRPLSNQTV